MELLATSDVSRAPSRAPPSEQQLAPRTKQGRKMPERGGKERRGKTVSRRGIPSVIRAVRDTAGGTLFAFLPRCLSGAKYHVLVTGDNFGMIHVTGA